MKALIFAAGLGTRLKPLTDTMPKALVPVGGKPLLEHVASKLIAAGYDQLVINVHHFADQIRAYVAERGGWGVDVQFSDETDLLRETGGGIRHAAPLLAGDEPFLVHNVDILSNLDLAWFRAQHREGDLATILVSERETQRYFLFDDEGRLVGWTNIATGEAARYLVDNGADAVSMQKCEVVWVDHCTFTSLNQTRDYKDGSTDITHGSHNVTVSWCRYTKTQKSCLVGHSNSESGDMQITATFHHNWFEASSSRHPRVRYGSVHVYNNLYDGNTTYGAGSAYGARVLVEYNYFDGVKLPTDICTYPAKDNNNSNLEGSVAGYLYPTQNVYVNKPANAKSPYPLSNVRYTKYGGTAGVELTYADFKPAYTYTVTAAADVAAVVKAGAGYGKLGYTSAPVAVDNGGITLTQ